MVTVASNMESPRCDDSLGQLHERLKTLEDDRISLALTLMRHKRWRDTGELNPQLCDNSSSCPATRLRDTLDEQQSHLDSYMKLLVQMISDTRVKINAVSRKHVRKLNILDLPDEILVQIWGYVKGWNDVYGPKFNRYTSKRVKALRLTCSRFCETSSHLLLPAVEVGLTKSSLDCLTAISEHPTIRKGILRVCVNLCYYDSEVASSLGAFVAYQADRLREVVRMWWAGSVYESPSTQEAAVLPVAYRHITNAHTSWTDWNSGIIDETQVCHLEALKDAFRAYQKLYQEQEELRQMDRFSCVVAQAWSRFPMVRRLEFYDNNIRVEPCLPLYKEMDDLGNFNFKNCLLPRKWDIWSLHANGEPPQEILRKLPGIIASRPDVLSSIDIDVGVSSTTAMSDLAPQVGDRPYFRMAVKELIKFKFEFPLFKAQHTPEQIDHVINDYGQYLTAMLNGDKLRDLDLCFTGAWNYREDPPNFSLNSLIQARPWRNLNSLVLTLCPMHLSELRLLVANLSSNMSYLSLHHTHLLSGTWLEALEILRAKAFTNVTFRRVTGGNLDDWTSKELHTVFGEAYISKPRHRTRAEAYVIGRLGENPITKLIASMEDTDVITPVHDLAMED